MPVVSSRYYCYFVKEKTYGAKFCNLIFTLGNGEFWGEKKAISRSSILAWIFNSVTSVTFYWCCSFRFQKAQYFCILFIIFSQIVPQQIKPSFVWNPKYNFKLHVLMKLVHMQMIHPGRIQGLRVRGSKGNFTQETSSQEVSAIMPGVIARFDGSDIQVYSISWHLIWIACEEEVFCWKFADKNARSLMFWCNLYSLTSADK